eukprot:TRINITY_DN5813_c0_g1_i3.p1 TRINITY_DN5813_c0_g1~~TRINITY_DN5813_c0_g1_i3.p1  ORF type:complete len:228 (+),score=58.27 TRINITY_DN5813_c0_g1_i3:218-901(+)
MKKSPLGHRQILVASFALNVVACIAPLGMKDNATVNAEFEYHVPRDIFKPRSNSDRELRERYIQAKYVQRAFTQRHADQLRQPPLPDPALRLARQSTAGMVEFHGVLIVNVVGATNLLNSDIIGKSDPYVVLKTMGGSGPGQTVRTKTIDDNLNPIWNERLQLCIEDKATASLDIRVFDEDLKDDELIGKAVLPLSDVGDNEEQRHNILLAPQGTLRLTLLYTPIAH